jgi:hypothetical protein
MEIVICAVIFVIGVIAGFFLRRLVTHPTGTILVTEEDEKTVYSLELNEYPEKIAFRKEVVFKVDSSQIDLSRE